MSQEENFIKILFRYYSNVLEKETVETMWANTINKEKGLYKIDNIPFYGPPVASDDIVFAEFDEEEKMLTYRKTVEQSGNSIIQVILLDKTKDINAIRKIFEDLGCQSERLNDIYFSMEIPFDKDYRKIKPILQELEMKEIIEFAEPCLSKNHRQ